MSVGNSIFVKFSLVIFALVFQSFVRAPDTNPSGSGTDQPESSGERETWGQASISMRRPTSQPGPPKSYKEYDDIRAARICDLETREYNKNTICDRVYPGSKSFCKEELINFSVDGAAHRNILLCIDDDTTKRCVCAGRETGQTHVMRWSSSGCQPNYGH